MGKPLRYSRFISFANSAEQYDPSMKYSDRSFAKQAKKVISELEKIKKEIAEKFDIKDLQEVDAILELYYSRVENQERMIKLGMMQEMGGSLPALSQDEIRAKEHFGDHPMGEIFEKYTKILEISEHLLNAKYPYDQVPRGENLIKSQIQENDRKEQLENAMLLALTRGTNVDPELDMETDISVQRKNPIFENRFLNKMKLWEAEQQLKQLSTNMGSTMDTQMSSFYLHNVKQYYEAKIALNTNRNIRREKDTVNKISNILRAYDEIKTLEEMGWPLSYERTEVSDEGVKQVSRMLKELPGMDQTNETKLQQYAHSLETLAEVTLAKERVMKQNEKEIHKKFQPPAIADESGKGRILSTNDIDRKQAEQALMILDENLSAGDILECLMHFYKSSVKYRGENKQLDLNESELAKQIWIKYKDDSSFPKDGLLNLCGAVAALDVDMQESKTDGLYIDLANQLFQNGGNPKATSCCSRMIELLNLTWGDDREVQVGAKKVSAWEERIKEANVFNDPEKLHYAAQRMAAADAKVELEWLDKSYVPTGIFPKQKVRTNQSDVKKADKLQPQIPTYPIVPDLSAGNKNRAKVPLKTLRGNTKNNQANMMPKNAQREQRGDLPLANQNNEEQQNKPENANRSKIVIRECKRNVSLDARKNIRHVNSKFLPNNLNIK